MQEATHFYTRAFRTLGAWPPHPWGRSSVPRAGRRNLRAWTDPSVCL